MDIVLFAEKIEQWRLPGDPARGGDIDAPGDDLSQGLYFVETRDQQIFAYQPSLLGTVRPDYMSHCEVKSSYSLR